MDLPDQSSSGDHPDMAAASWLRRLAGRAVPLLFLALVGWPLARFALRPELDAWRAAAAANRFDRGDQAGGLRDLRAVALPSGSPELRLALVRRMVEARQFAEAESVARTLAEEAFHQAGQGSLNPQLLHLAATQHAECLTILGREGEALRQVAAMVERLRSDGQVVDRWLENQLDYQRALAGEELAEASEGMERLFRAVEDRQPFGTLRNLPIPVRLLSAAALIGVRLGRGEELAGMLDHEIGLRAELGAEFVDRVRHSATDWMADPAPEAAMTLREDRAFAELNSQQLATLLTIRALLREADPAARDKSLQDRRQVQAMGFDADRILRALPDERACLETIAELAPLVDTLGWIRFRQNLPERAIGLLDLASVSGQLAADGIAGRWGESPGEFRDPAELERQRRKSLAVMYRHRGICRERLGQTEAAARDREQVRSMGYEWDDPTLF